MKLLSKNWIKTVSVITTIPFLSSCFDLQINSNGYDYPVGTLDLNKQSLISNNISVPIPYQQSNGQNYLRNHGLSFVVSKNNDQKGTYFNGFILNILQNSGNDFDIPDVRLKQDSTTPPTAKNKHDYQRPVTFLVATSFSNIKDLFNIPKLEDVNKNFSPTLFTGRTIKLGVMKFPDLISSSGKRDDYKLYQLDQDKKLEYDHNQLPNNFFLDVDPTTVKLVYTATNLSINQDLFAFDQNLTKINDPSIRKKIENKLTDVVWVQSYDPTSEQPLQTTLPAVPLVQNYNYKFAVDFAVFQLTIAKDAINPFLRDLIDNIENSTTDYSITKISQQFALNNSLKTNDFVIGGYHKLSAEEAAREIIENAEPIFRAKKKTIASQVTAEKFFLASEVDKREWNQYLEVSNLPSNIEVAKIEEVDANDDKGVISFYAYLRDKNNFNFVLKNNKVQVVPGFKAKSATISAEGMNALKKPPKPGVPKTKWIEAYVTSGTYSDQSIYNMTHQLWNQRIYSKKQFLAEHLKTTNLQKQYPVIQYGDDIFLKIDNEVITNGLDLHEGAAGSLVLTNSWDNQLVNFNQLGIYQGTRSSYNFFHHKNPKQGVFSLLTSPYRYDLFTATNRFSKPSLCDVLISKNLITQLDNKTTCSTNYY